MAAGTGRATGRGDRPDAVTRAGLLLWAPVWLSVGIAAWFAWPRDPSWVALAGLSLLALAGLGAASRVGRLADRGRVGWVWADGARLAALALLLTAAGADLAGLRAWRVEAPVLGFRYYGPIEGRVAEIDRSSRDRMRLTLDQVVLPGTDPARVPVRVRLSLMDDAALPPQGARVMTTGHLGPPSGPAEPGGFDFRRAAWFERLGAIGYTRVPVLLIAPPDDDWGMAMLRLRMRVAQAMRDRIGGQEGAVAAALMTGDRSGIAEATNQMMRDSNLYHIVSISGLHMSMLAGFVYAALRGALAGAQGLRLVPMALPVHKLAALVALAAAAGYLWLAGAEVATLRAFIMVAVMLAAILVDRRAISLRTVALAAVVILVLSPEALVTPGFQMSFAATVALVLMAGPWARWTRGWPIWIKAPAMLMVTSLVAALVTGPIAAAHFGRSSQYGLIANLLAVPVMGSLVMPAGVIAALLAPLGLAGPALWVMGLGTAWMLAVGEQVARLGGAVVAVPAPHPLSLPLLAVAGVIAALHPRSRPRALPVAMGVSAVLTAAAFGLWAAAERPALLIGPEGGQAGVLTAAGRALSKPGGAFIVESWLEGDGDSADAKGAAARPGWTGPRGARTARLGGHEVLHLTGRGAAERARAVCTRGAVVISSAPVPGETGGCVLFDPPRLAESGAVALSLDGERLVVTEARDARVWARAGRRPAWDRQTARAAAPEGGSGAGPEGRDRQAPAARKSPSAQVIRASQSP